MFFYHSVIQLTRPFTRMSGNL